MNNFRLNKELRSLQNSPPSGISCVPKDNSNYELLASMAGPVGSPYEKGVFQLEVFINEKYPLEPPRVRFITPIYHPNVDSAGRICLDLLKMPPSGSWKPVFGIESLLVSIQSLMANPNPDDPLMPEIASQFKYNKDEYEKQAETMTLQHACSSSFSRKVPNSHSSTACNPNEKRSDESQDPDIRKRARLDE